MMYLSDACTFLNCSVSPPPHSIFFILIGQTNVEVQNVFILYAYFTNPPQDGAHGKHDKIWF